MTLTKWIFPTSVYFLRIYKRNFDSKVHLNCDLRKSCTVDQTIVGLKGFVEIRVFHFTKCIKIKVNKIISIFLKSIYLHQFLQWFLEEHLPNLPKLPKSERSQPTSNSKLDKSTSTRQFLDFWTSSCLERNETLSGNLTLACS